jgi:ABC-type cobalamin/Fe3+-siderophores transport system ATPase subunit
MDNTFSTLDLRGLHFSYRQRPVIENLDASLRAGELVAIVGPNGCGKSTLLKLIVGALPAQSGSIMIDGLSAAMLGRIGLARRMALVPQMAGMESALGSSGAEGTFSVQQTVLMARYAAHVDEARGLLRAMGGLGIFGFETEHDLELARQAMWIADVHHLADRTADSLSGGERQRVAIARALAQQTPMLLLDEPTSALDLFHQLELIAHLRLLVAEGRLVVLVTHDLNLAAEIASRVLVMDQGKILADGTPADVLTPAVLEPVYHVRVTAEGGHLRFRRRQPLPPNAETPRA